jgi:hypothetical protein
VGMGFGKDDSGGGQSIEVGCGDES